jgi:hypothetical protein
MEIIFFPLLKSVLFRVFREMNKMMFLIRLLLYSIKNIGIIAVIPTLGGNYPQKVKYALQLAVWDIFFASSE